MSGITNDTEMRQALADLTAPAQRVLAARFVANVLSLSEDARLQRVLDTAANPDAGEDELGGAYRTAKAAALEAHARCGADGEWNDQAGYFVARAAEASVAPQVRSYSKGPAWQAAMSARMARTCLAGEADEDTHDKERQAQYRILTEYLTQGNIND
jgi:hypothetical protein